MDTKTSSFIKKAKAIHGSTYDYSRVVYVNAKTKVQIVCKKHGVFEQTPDKHINGKCGCPVCAGNVSGSTAGFVEAATKVHGKKYDYSLVQYVNNKTDVTIICPEHGEFLQSPTNHLSGKGCPHCANNVLLSTDEFIRKAREVHGLRYDYSVTKYEGNRKPVIVICRQHGPFEQVPYAHLSGSGCPVCGHIRSGRQRDAKAAYEKSVVTFMERFGVPNPMANSEIRRKHKEIVSSSEMNEKRVGTKRRNGTLNTSKPEEQMYKYLVRLFGESDVLRNYKSDKYPFLCDFYIPSRDLYIELNAHFTHRGHWYTEADEGTEIVWNNGKKSDTFSRRDVEKRRAAMEHNLNYLVFWKNDLSDFHQWVDSGCPDGKDWIREYSWKS